MDNFQLTDRYLIQEVMDHAKFCNESVEKFHGRNDLIDKVIQIINKFKFLKI
jgi:hypothetical protein